MPRNPMSWIRSRIKNRKVIRPDPPRIPSFPRHPGFPAYMEKGIITVDLSDPRYAHLTEDETYYVRQFMS